MGHVKLGQKVRSCFIARISSLIAQVKGTFFVFVVVLGMDTMDVEQMNLVDGGVLLHLMIYAEETSVLQKVMHLVFILSHQNLLTPPEKSRDFVYFIQDVYTKVEARILYFALQNSLLIPSEKVKVL